MNEWALTHPAPALEGLDEGLVGGLQGHEKVQRAAAMRVHRSRSPAFLMGADLCPEFHRPAAPFQQHQDGGAGEGDPEHAAETNAKELQIVMKARTHAPYRFVQEISQHTSVSLVAVSVFGRFLRC
ncbi:hypothetical protein GGD67_002728 [Bradyrhizobium sp. IAR9]|uniref:hypothetical protein n=1 Tax=Bradyrhizobium sp. IAR9 TaxID=2663841 RepID=UPI0015CCEB83|nr:hypothetical protein [Bradyrhizobium sp. IAR9]NYG45270.1 hypothetical protein [Bradyrhizobium sp. IAR9]